MVLFVKQNYGNEMILQTLPKKAYRESLIENLEYAKYYLKHEHECFIRYKARITSVLNSFKNDPFYTHLITLFTKELSI